MGELARLVLSLFMNEDLYKSPTTPSMPPSGPSMPPSSPFVVPPAAKKNWWMIIVLVAVVVLGAAYYFYYSAMSPAPEIKNMGMMKPKEVLPEDTAAVEEDLQAMPLNDLDSELQDIDAELAK